MKANLSTPVSPTLGREEKMDKLMEIRRLKKEINHLKKINADLFRVLGEAKKAIDEMQGEWICVEKLFSPQWTHALKEASEQLEQAISLAERKE